MPSYCGVFLTKPWAEKELTQPWHMRMADGPPCCFSMSDRDLVPKPIRRQITTRLRFSLQEP